MTGYERGFREAYRKAVNKYSTKWVRQMLVCRQMYPEKWTQPQSQWCIEILSNELVERATQ
jgi:hypothetical protein